VEWHVRLAYIDPVSGSILIQTLVAAVAGGAAFFRSRSGPSSSVRPLPSPPRARLPRPQRRQRRNPRFP